jgi:hypothetical protein
MTDHGISLNGAAHYYDRYLKTDDGWRIAETGYRRIFEEMWPRTAIDGINLTKNGFAP